jgi:hypothetical protein
MNAETHLQTPAGLLASDLVFELPLALASAQQYRRGTSSVETKPASFSGNGKA